MNDDTLATECGDWDSLLCWMNNDIPSDAGFLEMYFLVSNPRASSS